MSLHSLDWYALSREAVPGVLLGVETTSNKLETSRVPSDERGDFLVGYETLNASSCDTAACIALVSSDKIGEALSWVYTFSKETFPISQFCRIETFNNWRKFIKLDGVSDSEFQYSWWASLVAGEVLANAEPGIDLKSVSLSRALSSYSYPIARLYKHGGGPEDERVCASRLKAIESDSRFSRKKVGVDSLVALWASAQLKYDVADKSVRESVLQVLSSIDTESASLLGRNAKLASASAEMRIHGFDDFVDSILLGQKNSISLSKVTVGGLIAAAALIAGGGTSHLELLRPYIDDQPDCMPWFGFLAGIVGPKAWEADWLQMVKGIERYLREKFSWTEPMQGDLCWAEFEWLRLLSGSNTVFDDVPRRNRRMLAVEVFPGAVYHARLAAPLSADSKISSPAASYQPNKKPDVSVGSELRTKIVSDDDLTNLANLATKLSEVIAKISRERALVPEESQDDLFGGVATARIKVQKSAKRPISRAKKISDDKRK